MIDSCGACGGVSIAAFQAFIGRAVSPRPLAWASHGCTFGAPDEQESVKSAEICVYLRLPSSAYPLRGQARRDVRNCARGAAAERFGPMHWQGEGAGIRACPQALTAAKIGCARRGVAGCRLRPPLLPRARAGCHCRCSGPGRERSLRRELVPVPSLPGPCGRAWRNR